MKGRLLALILAICLLAGCAQSPATDSPDSPDTPNILGPSTVPENQSPNADPPTLVYTDWSKLTPYEPVRPLYTYSDHYCGGRPLQAWDGYGLLLPYVGADLELEHYIVDSLPLFGLTTARGEIVTDAVYADIVIRNGFLLLYRGTEELYKQRDPMLDWGDFDLTVAALDGSWVRDAVGYYYASSWSDNGLLALGTSNGGFEFWNSAGETIAVFPAEAFQPYFGSSFMWSAEGGPWAEWQYDGLVYVLSYDYLGQSEEGFLRLYLDLATGQILEEVPEGYPEEPVREPLEDRPEFPGYYSAWSVIDDVTGAVYYEAYREIGDCNLLDEDGNEVWKNYGSFSQVMGGLVAVWPGRWENGAEATWFSWYDLKTGECMFRYPVSDNSD